MLSSAQQVGRGGDCASPLAPSRPSDCTTESGRREKGGRKSHSYEGSVARPRSTRGRAGRGDAHGSSTTNGPTAQRERPSVGGDVGSSLSCPRLPVLVHESSSTQRHATPGADGAQHDGSRRHAQPIATRVLDRSRHSSTTREPCHSHQPHPQQQQQQHSQEPARQAPPAHDNAGRSVTHSRPHSPQRRSVVRPGSHQTSCPATRSPPERQRTLPRLTQAPAAAAPSPARTNAPPSFSASSFGLTASVRRRHIGRPGAQPSGMPSFHLRRGPSPSEARARPSRLLTSQKAPAAGAGAGAPVHADIAPSHPPSSPGSVGSPVGGAVAHASGSCSPASSAFSITAGVTTNSSTGPVTPVCLAGTAADFCNGGQSPLSPPPPTNPELEAIMALMVADMAVARPPEDEVQLWMLNWFEDYQRRHSSSSNGEKDSAVAAPPPSSPRRGVVADADFIVRVENGGGQTAPATPLSRADLSHNPLSHTGSAVGGSGRPPVCPIRDGGSRAAALRSSHSSPRRRAAASATSVRALGSATTMSNGSRYASPSQAQALSPLPTTSLSTPNASSATGTFETSSYGSDFASMTLTEGNHGWLSGSLSVGSASYPRPPSEENPYRFSRELREQQRAYSAIAGDLFNRMEVYLDRLGDTGASQPSTSSDASGSRVASGCSSNSGKGDTGAVNSVPAAPSDDVPPVGDADGDAAAAADSVALTDDDEMDGDSGSAYNGGNHAACAAVVAAATPEARKPAEGRTAADSKGVVAVGRASALSLLTNSSASPNNARRGGGSMGGAGGASGGPVTAPPLCCRRSAAALRRSGAGRPPSTRQLANNACFSGTAGGGAR